MKAIYRGKRYSCLATNERYVHLLDGPSVEFGNPDLIIEPVDSEWLVAFDPPSMPVYMETDQETLRPGLYLGLFHGRILPSEPLDDWGFNGPLIGPLLYVHTTYAHHIKFQFASVETHDLYFQHFEHGDGSNDFVLVDDLLEYQGKYYGDWSVFNIPEVPASANLLVKDETSSSGLVSSA